MLFFLLASTFFLLAGGVVNATVDKVAGWFGIITAATAYWLGAAEIVNDIIGGGKSIIPLGSFSQSYSGATHVSGKIQSEVQRQVIIFCSLFHFIATIQANNERNNFLTSAGFEGH